MPEDKPDNPRENKDQEQERGEQPVSEAEIKESRKIVLDAIGEVEEDDLPDIPKQESRDILSKKQEKPADETAETDREEAGQKMTEDEKKDLLDAIGKNVLSKEASGNLAPNMLKASGLGAGESITAKPEPKHKLKYRPKNKTRKKPATELKAKQAPKQEKKKNHLFPDWLIHLFRLRIGKKNNSRESINRLAIRAIFWTIFFVLASLLAYAVFSFAVLKLHPDNQVFRSVSQYVFVPALVSKYGAMDFYDYYDSKTDFMGNGYTEIEAREAVYLSFARQIAINRLIPDYELLYQTTPPTREEVSRIVVSDQSINLVASSRIKKIKEMVLEEGGFMEIGNTYADKAGRITLAFEDLAEFDYGQELRELEAGETSGLIVSPNGYYIYRLMEKSDKALVLDYIFVEAKTLDDYLDSCVRTARIWNLAG
jgi:hypothetical protein